MRDSIWIQSGSREVAADLQHSPSNFSIWYRPSVDQSVYRSNWAPVGGCAASITAD